MWDYLSIFIPSFLARMCVVMALGIVINFLWPAMSLIGFAAGAAVMSSYFAHLDTTE